MTSLPIFLYALLSLSLLAAPSTPSTSPITKSAPELAKIPKNRSPRTIRYSLKMIFTINSYGKSDRDRTPDI